MQPSRINYNASQIVRARRRSFLHYVFCARSLMAALTTLILFAAAPAVAIELLNCQDTKVTGFHWSSDGFQRATFDPIEFQVAVIEPSRRTIKFSVYPGAIDYDCVQPSGSKSLFCTSTLVGAVESIIFSGMKFERVVNWSKYVGGQSVGLAVAYGTCR